MNDQEGDRPHLRQGGELLPLDHRIGEGAVILDRHVLLGDDQKEDRQDHHDGRDHDPHLEEPPVHELDDVQVGLGGQEVRDAHHQRRGEIGEGPDEDQKRPGDVAGGGQREGDVPELADPPGPDALGRLIQGGRDLPHGVDDGEGHQGEKVQRLHQEHPVEAVHEIDRVRETEIVLEDDVDRSGAAQDEDEPHDADQRGHDHRDDRQVREEPPAGKIVPQAAERRWRSR